MEHTIRGKRARMGVAIVLVLLLALMSQGVVARPALVQENEAPSRTAGSLGPSGILVSYQGTLTDQNGNPIDTTVTMKFALYDAASGGNLKWGTETQSVEVSNGLFNVLLGSVKPINSAELIGDLWLDITVNEEQLTPRERISSVPYAVEASTLPNGAETRGWLKVLDDLTIISPGTGSMRALELWRTDEDNRTHRWRFWHMNQQYGMNSLQIWEYRTDSSGIDCGGNVGDGAICDPRFMISQGGNVGIGTTSDWEASVMIQSDAVPLKFKEGDQNGLGSLWRMPLDGTHLRFDASENGTDFSAFNTPLTLYPDGSVGCGALTENNLQTDEERAAGGSDRFEEGDVLCWGIDQLEKCSIANDRLVQAVTDKSGRPIVIGAEVIRVLGPVKRGDILVASDVPGYAMVNNDPASGSVIAQALEDFVGGRGIIKAMIRKF